MKYEWRKQEKTYYLPKQKPQVLTLSEMSYITLESSGDPNREAFAFEISALYALSYGMRMSLKKGVYGEPFEYTVYPLEGIWTSLDGSKGAELQKDQLHYKIMIRQPDCVTAEMFQAVLQQVAAKKVALDFSKVRFETITDGLSVQILHLGSYDTEPASFAKLEAYLEKEHLQRRVIDQQFQHREIYLSDPRKIEPAKQKTVLRLAVDRDEKA